MPSYTQLFFLYTQSKHINAYFLRKDRYEQKWLCLQCIMLKVYAMQHKNNRQQAFFSHHPWWHRSWYWAETLPEGPAPPHAVSWSAGAEPLCWAGPSKAPDASSAASAPAVPSVNHMGERKWRGTSFYVYISFMACDWNIAAYIRLLLNITRGWGDFAKLENIHSLSRG